MGEEGGNGQNVLGGIGKKFGQVNMKDPLTMTFFVCKAFEILFSIFAILLSQFWPFEGTKHWRRDMRTYTDPQDAVIFTTLYGYLLINSILVISRFIGEELSSKMLIMFSAVGVLLNCVAGFLLIDFGDDNEVLPDVYLSQMRPVAFLCVLNAFLLGVETLSTKKFARYEK